MADEKFHLVSNYAPTGDQPQAIEQLVEGVERGDRCQTLLGVTGSGKTFTMANVIARCNRPTLVLAHNKTLAAQLCTEFRSFFPDNAVEYFVSYYDYYQPEAYIPSTDTYIEKDSAINDEIDRLRHSATAALSERRDVIIVASVSCIYSLGDPIDYRSMVISLRPGMQMERDDLCKKLVTLQYERNDINFIRNKFRVHGDTVDIYLAYMSDLAIRVEFFGDEIDRITEFNPVTGTRQNVVKHVAIFPASHYIVSADKKAAAIEKIRAECDEQVKKFTAEGKLIEAQRIQQRHAAEGEILRRPHGKERGQLQHQVCASAQRRLRARPFVQTGGFAALHERARHRADEKICVCQLLCTRKLVRMTVMKRVVFANDAANLHFLLFSFSKAGKRAIITIGISGS